MADSQPVGAKTDEELVLEARAGSRRSFDELALRYKRRLFVYLRPRLGSDEDAEDMVQETFLKLYRNLHRYDPAFRFSTWLYTSASRLAISSFRRMQRARKSLGSQIDAEAADLPVDGGAGRLPLDIWGAARELGGSQFRVLWLRYGEGLSVTEIAVALGKSELAVRLLLHRGRRNLMRRLGTVPGRTADAAEAAAGSQALDG